MSNIGGKLMKVVAKVLIGGALAYALSSCEDYTQGEAAKDYGQFRVDNGSTTTVGLYVNGELRVTAEPKQKKSTRAPSGLVEVSVRTEAGKVLWSQMADVPDNAFAQYNVQPNLSVILTAGNIAKPYRVGSNDEQVRLENHAAFPVEILINGQVIGAVGPYLYAIYDVPHGVITVSFRRVRSSQLFSQTMDVPRNAYFTYTVLPNGHVIATGGEVDENIQFQRDDYYNGYYDGYYY
jgi:hypothetical protein